LCENKAVRSQEMHQKFIVTPWAYFMNGPNTTTPTAPILLIWRWTTNLKVSDRVCSWKAQWIRNENKGYVVLLLLV